METRVQEDPDHRRVLGQGVRVQVPDPTLTGDCGQLLQEQRADAPAVHGVVDEESHLGLVGSHRFVAADTDHGAVDFGHQRNVAAVRIGADQMMGVLVGIQPAEGEEPEVDRPIRGPVVDRLQRGFGHGRAVAGYNGMAPCGGYGRRGRHAGC